MIQKVPSVSTRTKRLIALALATSLLTVSFITLSWLQRNNVIENKTVISDFKIEGQIYFISSGTSDNAMKLSDILTHTPYKKLDGEAMIPINLTDKNADNFIGNLRIVLKYTGMSPAYVRVRLLEQWTENDEFIESVFPDYNIPQNNADIFLYSDKPWTVFPSYENSADKTQVGTQWYDNRTEDFCYYYNAPVYPHDTSGTVNMLLINGMSEDALNKMGNLREENSLQMMIQAEAVQPNRYREFFDLEKLPWEP